MTLSPDGNWLWTGVEWIPAPPTVAPPSSFVSDPIVQSAAREYNVQPSTLSSQAIHFDLNRDGQLSKQEIYTAASAIASPPVVAAPVVVDFNDNTASLVSRNLEVRVLAAFCWFVLLYIVSNMIIGGIVGGIAGAGTDGSYDEAAAASEKAVKEFFQNYGLGYFIVQILLFSVLASAGLLPGTGKLKSINTW